MDKNKLIQCCLINDDALETYPFKDKNYNDVVVMRHACNDKWFALIFQLEGKLYVNLKCKPIDSAILRDEYSFITPAWHMNKTHWIKVDIKKCPISLLKNLIAMSFDLTL